MKKAEKLSSGRTWIWMALVFASIIMVRVPLAAFLKHTHTYEDERLYYSMAESLSEGKGFPVIYYGAFHSSRFLYSLLISPAFFTSNRTIQFFLIDLINTLILSSGIFPVYLLAKTLLEETKYALLCCSIYSLLPDQALNISFMCDPLFTVLSLWLFYFGEKILEWEDLSGRERIRFLLCFGLFWIGACYTKQAGAVFGAVLLFLVLLKRLIRCIQNRKIDLYLLFVLLLTISLAVFVLLQKGSLSKNVRNYADIALNMVKEDPKAFLKEYAYVWTNYLAAIGIFPIALPYIYLDKLTRKGRYFTVYLTACIGILSFGVAHTSIGASVHRVHLRYVGMMWIPFMILFFLAFKEERLKNHGIIVETMIPQESGYSGNSRSKSGKRLEERSQSLPDHASSEEMTLGKTGKEKLTPWEIAGWGIFYVGLILMVLFYHGVDLTESGKTIASVDYTMLCWTEKWSAFRSFYAFAFAVIFLALSILYFWYKKAFLIVFLCLFGTMQLYNNVVITKRLREDYRLLKTDAEEAMELDAFVRQNSDAVFLVLESVNKGDELQSTFSTKLSDTFLNQKNTLRVSAGDIMRIQEAEGICLSETPLPVWWGEIAVPFYPIQPVDFLLVPLDTSVYPDLTMCTEVDPGRGNYYQAYRLNDPNRLPKLVSPAFLSPGQSTFYLDSGRKHTEPGFLSERMDENGNAVHTSGKEPGYALFGPGITLQPGEYTVTFYLSNTEYPDELVLGFTELSSSNMNLHDTMRDFHQGTASVTYKLNLTEPCEGFETQVYTWVPGVTVEKVVIDYVPVPSERRQKK